jgi:hypothetical protein
MLPMILSFLGSAFAPAIGAATGIAALSSPLLMSAVGQGLGTAIQEKDLKAGLLSGLGSFAGGKLVGGLMGSTAGGALQQPLAGQSVMGAGANAMTTGTPLSAAGGVNALMPPPAAAPTGLAGLFGQAAPGTLKSQLGTALRSGMDFAKSGQGIGSMIGGSLGALAAPAPTVKTEDSEGKNKNKGPKEMRPIPRVMRMPDGTYRPGVDPEFDYGISTPYSYGQLNAYNNRGALPYAEGGEVQKPNEKTEIVEAVAAIKGQHPQPEVALGKFLAKYGEEALRDLVESVGSGELDDTRERFANGENGVVRGPGDGSGVDDKVPATIDGEQDVLLSDGEFVLRKDATDALEKKFGGGFLSAVNSAGKKAPEVMQRRAMQ